MEVLGAQAAALDDLVIESLGIFLEAVVEEGGGVARPVFGKPVGRDAAPAFDAIGIGGCRAKQIELSRAAHGGEKFLRVVFLVGEHQRFDFSGGLGWKNLGRHGQKIGGCPATIAIGDFGDRRSRGSQAQADRLAGFAVEKKKALPHFRGLFLAAEAVAAHLTFGVASHAVGIKSQQPAAKMFSRSPQLAQSDLQMPGLLDGASFEQIVDGGIGGDKGQSIGELKTLLRKGALAAIGAQAHGRLVHQVKSHPRFDSLACLAAPSA